MSLLINDELIWVSTPKSASTAIFNSLMNSNLKIKKFNEVHGHLNPHLNLNLLKTKFGNKESICITRDWFKKWISALNYIWDIIEYHSPYNPIIKWEDVDNKFVYKLFDDSFLNLLHSANEHGYYECFKILITEKEMLDKKPSNENWYRTMGLMISEKYYKSNSKCTYEFDIKDVDKFAEFIEKRFGEKIIIENENKSSKRENKIILNDEFKFFVWDKFEKRFEKNNQLI
jgi:hypothetical protein